MIKLEIAFSFSKKYLKIFGSLLDIVPKMIIIGVVFGGINMIKPLNNNVVLKKDKIVKETASGIVLSNKEEQTEYAKVIAIGSGKVDEKGKITPIDLKVGDKVIYKNYSSTNVKLDGEEYLIVDASDILAVLE